MMPILIIQYLHTVARAIAGFPDVPQRGGWLQGRKWLRWHVAAGMQSHVWQQQLLCTTTAVVHVLPDVRVQQQLLCTCCQTYGYNNSCCARVISLRL